MSYVALIRGIFDGDRTTILQVQRFQIVVTTRISQVNTSIEATHRSFVTWLLHTFCHASSILDLTT